MAVRLVVTDMDNTLYSWVDYIVPALEAMVDEVCRTTRLARPRVLQSLKEVYARYESNDYPFALQESDLLDATVGFERFDLDVIAPARAAFARARAHHLRPYPDVETTLQALKNRQLPIVALTDAPRNPAELRAKQLGLDSYLDAIYTLPGFAFPRAADGTHRIAAEIRERDGRGEYRAGCKVVELPRDFEKPHPGGLTQICRDFGVEPKEVVLIGDSLARDIALAQACGALDCWAYYGTVVSPLNRERLEAVSARKVTARHAASLLPQDRASTEPRHTLQSFGQLLEVLGS